MRLKEFLKVNTAPFSLVVLNPDTNETSWLFPTIFPQNYSTAFTLFRLKDFLHNEIVTINLEKDEVESGLNYYLEIII